MQHLRACDASDPNDAVDRENLAKLFGEALSDHERATLEQVQAIFGALTREAYLLLEEDFVAREKGLAPPRPPPAPPQGRRCDCYWDDGGRCQQRGDLMRCFWCPHHC